MPQNSLSFLENSFTRREFNSSIIKYAGKIVLSYSILSGIEVFSSGKKLFADSVGSITFSPEMPDETIAPDMGLAPNKPLAYEHRYEVILPYENAPFYFGVKGAEGKVSPSWTITTDADNPLKKYVNVRFAKGQVGESANLEMVFSDVPVGIKDTLPPVIKSPQLSNNYPNPFNGPTNIEYKIHKPSQVSLKIYNMAGQFIKTLVDENQNGPRNYSVRWNGLDDKNQETASGVYIGLLQTPYFNKAIRMVKLK